jgi:hypothetical protein
MRWTLWIAFAVLCVLSGTSWAIPREMSDGLPPLEKQGVLFGGIGWLRFYFLAAKCGLEAGVCGMRGWLQRQWDFLEFRWWLLNMREAVCRQSAGLRCLLWSPLWW